MAKHSIDRKSVRFCVNKEKRKIVAYVQNTEEYFISFVADNAPELLPFIYKNFDYYLMKNRYVASAQCSKEDKWDEEFGCLVAYDRLKYALNQGFFKRAQSLIREVEKSTDKLIDIFNSYGDKLDYNAQRRENIIKEKLGE